MQTKKLLTLISVPIGNLEDITIRALKAIFSFDCIVAEDTRNYIKLRNLLAERFEKLLDFENLQKFHQPELISYREQNHNHASNQIIKKINEGKSVGYMSDAGMPTISDPGYKLVRECLKNNIEVTILPGAVAVESALAISGLPSDKFTFLGFLPKEKGKIKKIIEANFHNTVIYYESPFRLIKSLETIANISSDFVVSASNELTKKFETNFRGNITNVIESLKSQKKIKGEWCVVIYKFLD
jgi:16S rRNA (cytidine1402-2'-O)-methyltransferase